MSLHNVIARMCQRFRRAGVGAYMHAAHAARRYREELEGSLPDLRAPRPTGGFGTEDHGSAQAAETQHSALILPTG